MQTVREVELIKANEVKLEHDSESRTLRKHFLIVAGLFLVCDCQRIYISN